ICAGLAARTSNMPRYAAAQILIASVCFFAGLLHSQVAELRLMAGQTVIGTIALVFLVRQHSAALVATIRLATENRFLASHDPLTGLANRMQLRERIGFLLGTHGKAHRAGDRDFSLLYIDLDGFKGVNDAHGHAVGDRLLKAVADRLLALMRSVDLVARIGGDEFMVILAGTDLQQVAGTAERLIAALSLPYELQDDLQVSIGASIGSITADRDTVSADALIAQADHGMYAAKRAGGGVHRRGV
ncbi:MAG: GGDEF domain-containing protein, partial [Pseudomonadota bacterium]|nr:GGDEF domain-containing protein [Pseudomonadota bacterium]